MPGALAPGPANTVDFNLTSVTTEAISFLQAADGFCLSFEWSLHDADFWTLIAVTTALDEPADVSSLDPATAYDIRIAFVSCPDGATRLSEYTTLLITTL